MQRLRSLTGLAVLALLAGVALAGCQSGREPGTAAAVGDYSISTAEVDAAVSSIEANVEKIGQQPLPKDAWGDLRQFVVQQSVFNEVARRYAAEKGVPLPPGDYATVAQQTGLPADDPYVKLSADGEAYRAALLERAAPQTPTEADLKDGYDRFVAAVGETAATFDDVRPQLEQLPEFRSGLGLRSELDAAAERYGTSVNPRYQPAEAPLTIISTGQAQLVLVALQLGEPSTDAVVDTSVD